jgi:hypothetical protein
MGIGVAIVASVVMANFYEWWIHKYILHILGRKKGNFWRFHWSTHHRVCRGNNNHDDKIYFKEVITLVLLVVAHIPVFYIYPVVFATIAVYAVLYYTFHRYSHLNPRWGKRYMPWHWDHHMGRNQDANWCILFPLFDYLLSTREKSQH